MNREQKRALTILISMSLAVVLAIAAVAMKALHVRWLSILLLFFVAAVPCAGGVAFFRLRPPRGAVAFDERDGAIQRNATLTAYGIASVLLMVVFFASIFVLGESASVPVTWPLAAFVGSQVIFAYAFFISLFVQYRRGGNDGRG